MKTLTAQQIYRKQSDGLALHPEERDNTTRHIISVLLENQMGSLNRVLNMFAARGFNLESVAVGETEDPTISRLTLVTSGNTKVIRQIVRQLNRLIDTLEVVDLTDVGDYVEREICLLKVSADENSRQKIKENADIFGAKVVDITHESLTLEASGPTTKIKAFLALMTPFGIREVARSGRVALSRPLIHGD